MVKIFFQRQIAVIAVFLIPFAISAVPNLDFLNSGPFQSWGMRSAFIGCLRDRGIIGDQLFRIQQEVMPSSLLMFSLAAVAIFIFLKYEDVRMIYSGRKQVSSSLKIIVSIFLFIFCLFFIFGGEASERLTHCDSDTMKILSSYLFAHVYLGFLLTGSFVAFAIVTANIINAILDGRRMPRQ